jgi:hypothetical protein
VVLVLKVLWRASFPFVAVLLLSYAVVLPLCCYDAARTRSLCCAYAGVCLDAFWSMLLYFDTFWFNLLCLLLYFDTFWFNLLCLLLYFDTF